MADQRQGGISWTHHTWNPIRGCSRVSPGCQQCYAEVVAARFCGDDQPYAGLARRNADGEARWTGEVRMVPEHLADPLRWKRPRRVFVNSMSDLFHENLTNEQIAAVFGVMAAAPQHTFQCLTKRAERMREWFDWIATDTAGRLFDAAVAEGVDRTNFDNGFPGFPLPNVHLGVSCEDQERADERIPLLLQCPAAVRWVSAEPVLGSIDFHAIPNERHGLRFSALTLAHDDRFGSSDTTIDWIAVGGESGPGARPCRVEWIRDIVRQCREAGVPAFVKQLGGVVLWNGTQGGYGDGPSDVWPTGTKKRESNVGWRVLLKHSKGGDPMEWPEDLRIREFPNA